MKVKMPEISGSGEEIILTAWHVNEKEHVNENDEFLEVVTDKASFDLPAPCGGTVVRLLKNIGEKINVGDVIAEIEEDQ